MEASNNIWIARDDSEEAGDTRRIAHIVQPIEQATQQLAHQAVLLGFSCDAGVQRNQGRIGAAQGPDALRKALAGLPALHLKTLWDAGNVVCESDGLEQAQSQLAQTISDLLGRQARIVVMGGGHEIAWGSFSGLHQWLENTKQKGKIAIINFDAHFDIRTQSRPSSGTPFLQIIECLQQSSRPFQYACWGVSDLANTPALFAKADRLGVHYRFDRSLQESALGERLQELKTLIADVEHIYISVDLDVLSAAIMPAVSAPAPLGVPLFVLETLLIELYQDPRVCLIDFAEFNPKYDQDQHGAKAAARLIWQVLQRKQPL